jgi:hypothetical protein
MAKADFCSNGIPCSGVAHFDKPLKLIRDAEHEELERRSRRLKHSQSVFSFRAAQFEQPVETAA